MDRSSDEDHWCDARSEHETRTSDWAERCASKGLSPSSGSLTRPGLLAPARAVPLGIARAAHRSPHEAGPFY